MLFNLSISLVTDFLIVHTSFDIAYFNCHVVMSFYVCICMFCNLLLLQR